MDRVGLLVLGGAMKQDMVEQYETLREREQVFVDSVAQLRQEKRWQGQGGRPGMGTFCSYDVAEKMSELGGEPYNVGYMQAKKEEMWELIEERTQVFANRRSDGEGVIRTERGNASYEGPEKGLDGMMQHITERPNKSGEEDMVALTVRVTEDELFTLLRSADDKVARKVFRQILEGEGY